MSWEIFCVPKNCDRERTGRTRGSLEQGPSPASHQSCAPPTHFLIANLELELNVSPIRINELKFSNRKYFAIFRVGPRHLVTNSLAGAFLIETARLESLATPTKQSPISDSNRDKTRVLRPPWRNRFLRSAFHRHSGIRDANNSLCDSVPLWPSFCANSRATLTLRAPQSNLPASCFVRAPLGEHS
jgi:hypothetical protein